MNYIRFERVTRSDEDKYKTKVWDVLSAGGLRIGCIGWYGPWRRYVLGTPVFAWFDSKCLREVSDFCDAETVKHQNKNKAARLLAAGESVYSDGGQERVRPIQGLVN